MKHDGKIVILIPYFGKFPTYFSLWLESCKKNSNITWMLFTDDREQYHYPKNVIVHYMEFKDFVNLIAISLGKEYRICSPYKICDYRPAFGEIFSQYISSFDFWGYGDVDVIYGDFSKFSLVNRIIENERTFELGHLSFIKNDEIYNTLYKAKVFKRDIHKKILNANVNFSFDELLFNAICEKRNLKWYRDELYADIDYERDNFSLSHTKFSSEKKLKKTVELNGIIFEWDEGSLLGWKYINGKWNKTEYLYVHLQKRKMDIDHLKNHTHYMIIPNRFVDCKPLGELIQYSVSSKRNVDMPIEIQRKVNAIKRRLICPQYFSYLKR